MAKLGADFIKVMASGGGTVNTMSWLPSFSREELRALADEAHRLGRRITAHCLCADATEWVLDAGFDGIEHASFIVGRERRQEYVPAIADKLARAGIPTPARSPSPATCCRGCGQSNGQSAAEQAMLDRWLFMFDDNLSQFRRMHEAGRQLGRRHRRRLALYRHRGAAVTNWN